MRITGKTNKRDIVTSHNDLTGHFYDLNPDVDTENVLAEGVNLKKC